MSTPLEPLRFEPFTTSVATAFWVILAKKKLNELKLDDSEVPIWGRFLAGQQGKTPRLYLNEESFGPPREGRSSSLLEVTVAGSIKLFNTLAEFKACKKSHYSKQVLDEIESSTANGDFDGYLRACRFRIIAFADLKKHQYTYNLLYPTPFNPEALPTYSTISAIAMEELPKLQGAKLSAVPIGAGCVDGKWIAIDPTPGSIDGVLGWPSRIIAFWLYMKQVAALEVSVVRQSSGQVYVLGIGPLSATPNQLTGWEKDHNGQTTPTTVNLTPLMDPKRLAAEATELNLKLMKWRLLPLLDLDTFHNSRALLFGAGTLGCNVTRLLLGWGWRQITLVDSGRVSFSNPVRQSLFTFEDGLNGGRPKAEAAAMQASAIDPNATIKGIDLKIPMPGHLVEQEDDTLTTLGSLIELVKEHDILFLLTDSRESRWVPSVLGSALNKVVITIALGFDSFVAMRHGSSSLNSGGDRLACYFCQDVRGPTDTLSDRTLDQQCTVSRPGISMMAAATGVELAASLLQHPLKVDAPATSTRSATDSLPNDASLLGIVPHQVRGFLSHFQTMQLIGEASKCCTACSEEIQKSFLQDGANFILSCLKDFSVAETASGVGELRLAGEANDVLAAEPVTEGSEGSAGDNQDFFLL